MPTPLAQTRRPAFTLIEMLVVISLIAVLLAILMPALGSARRHGRMTRELAASRQLNTVYLMFPVDHKGRLLPGHVNYPAGLTDHLGRTLSAPEVANRWPWRLLDYADLPPAGLVVVNKQAEALSNPNAFFWDYSLSISTSFGLNLYGVGGYFSGGTTVAGLPSGAADLSMPGCVTRIDQASDPTGLLTFATAGSEGDAGSTVHGYWRVSPPKRPYEYGATGWTEQPYRYPDDGPPNLVGWVHPRWFDKALTTYLDGHSSPAGLEELRDMRRWSDQAQRNNDPNDLPLDTP
ncbi:MAG: type II secretion system protein [Phycisphaerales bacterium JB063]